MKAHPLAEIFPSMDGEDFSTFVADVKKRGLLSPVVTLDGQILDGRNRWMACEQLGIKPATVEYDGDDPLGYVVSMNLSRRHLTPGQRAMVAEKIVTTTHGGVRSKWPRGHLKPVSREKASIIADASTRTMGRVRVVLDKGTEQLQNAVASGKIEPHVAAKLADAPKETQRAAVDGGKAVAREIVAKLAAEKEPANAAKLRTLGIKVPVEIEARAEKEQALIDKMSGLLSELKRTFTAYESLTGVEQHGKRGHVSSALRAAFNEFNLIRGKRPAAVCPYCKILPELMPTCASCRGSGVICESDLEHVEKALLAEGDDSGVWVNGKWRTYASMTGDDF
jgi:hypothetical protein